MSDLTNPHDKFFKETFGRLEVARDFFAHYLPATVTAVLDLSTLDRQADSFIDPDLQEQFADLLYSVMEYLRTVLYYIGKAASQLDRQEMIEIVATTLQDKGSSAMQTPAQEWIEEGIKQGVEQGRQQERYEIARHLLKLHNALVVSEITGLSLDEVQQLLEDSSSDETIAHS